jgi:ribosomal protein L12E/L44/L45/RPP1/RPP2
VNTRRTNLSQNNTHEEVESIGLEARIANLQKNLEDLLAQNAVLQADRTPSPSQHLERGENSQNEDHRVAPSEHPEGSREEGEPRNEDNVLHGKQPLPLLIEAERKLQ